MVPVGIDGNEEVPSWFLWLSVASNRQDPDTVPQCRRVHQHIQRTRLIMSLSRRDLLRVGAAGTALAAFSASSGVEPALASEDRASKLRNRIAVATYSFWQF